MPNKKIENLSGGLFEAENKTQIPGISWSKLSNWDMSNSTIKTRNGAQRKNSTGIQGGCLQFGFSDTERDHTLVATGGDYEFGATTNSNGNTFNSSWNCFVYVKELSSTTSEREILSIAKESGASVYEDSVRLYFYGEQVRLQWREDSTQSYKTLSSNTSVIKRSAISDNLIGVSFSYEANTLNATMYIGSSTVGSNSWALSGGYEEGGATTWSATDTLILGSNDELNDSYNLYGYMGEVCITKNENIDNTDVKHSYNAIPPGDYCQEANRIAYYPLVSDYGDEWGVNPSFSEKGLYDTGGGLSAYMVKNNIVNSASTFDRPNDILYNTKSMHVDTYDVKYAPEFESSTLDSQYGEYLSSSTQSNVNYTITFDILPVSASSDTAAYRIFTQYSRGPHISIGYKDGNNCLIKFKHRSTTENITTTMPIKNNKISKVSCEYEYVSGSTGRVTLYNNLSEVSTNTGTVTDIRGGKWVLGISDLRLIDIEFYLSGMVIHSDAVIDDWNDVPKENISRVTTVSTNMEEYQDYLSQKEDYESAIKASRMPPEIAKRFFSKPSKVTLQTETNTEQVVGGKQSYHTLNEIYNFHTDVVALYLFNELSGYDASTDSTPNGIIQNTYDNSTSCCVDLIGSRSKRPIWVTDRNSVGLTTTHYLKNIDNSLQYKPTNPNISGRLFLNYGPNLVDDTGTTYTIDTEFDYYQRLNGSMRGFMYGNSLYLHNSEAVLRYTGRSLLPVETPTPSIPPDLTLTGTTGLNGAYMYAYTYVDENGNESYPTIPTATTVSGQKVRVFISPRLTQKSFAYKMIDKVNVYRNKGTTLSTTDLDLNAGVILYKIRTFDKEGLLDPGGITFDDNTADYYLQQEAPMPGQADPVPPCKYSCLHNDTAYYTGDENAPNMFYISSPEQPGLLSDYLPRDEFRTEDGEQNSAIASVPNGIIVFKENTRLYISDSGTRNEYSNGCVSHDSLVNVENGVIGLGPDGFFWTNGPQWKDITKSIINRRDISDIQYAVDSWSSDTKESAYAVYHKNTARYICYVNDTYYIYHTKRNVWRTYEDVIGRPVIYNNDLYIYKYGWLWEELSSQSYFGDDAYIYDVLSAVTGEITVSATTMPAIAEGTPIYIDNEYAWITSITSNGSNYVIRTDSNTNLNGYNKIYMGVVECRANHYWDMVTPSKYKIFGEILVEHDETVNGEIILRFTRDGTAFNNDYDDYIADTDNARIKYLPRICAKNMGVQFTVKDGKSHTLNTYTIEYEQGIY